MFRRTPRPPVQYERQVEDWVDGFMEACAGVEAPDRFKLFAGIGALAGAMQTKVVLPFSDTRRYYPNMYVIFVAPPGFRKSGAVNEAFDYLRLALGKDNYQRGPDDVTSASLYEEFQAVSRRLPDPLDPRGYSVASPLLCAPDELASFLDMDDRSLITALTLVWDVRADPFRKITKTQGNNTVVKPWMLLLGGTTPAWIQGNMPASEFEGGFGSRCIFVWSDEAVKPIPFEDEIVGEEHRIKKGMLVEDLKHIYQNVSGRVVLSGAAREWYREWYRHNNEVRRPKCTEAAFAGYLARRQVHMLKLSMVLSVSESDSLRVEEKHMERAAAILDDQEEGMQRVFGFVSRNPAMQVGHQILAQLEKAPRDKSQLMRLLRDFCNRRDFDEALQTLVRSGDIRLIGNKYQRVQERVDE